jgi:hypothetical protein
MVIIRGREIAELLTNSFDVKFGRLFIQPPLFRLVSIAEGVMILHGSIIG